MALSDGRRGSVSRMAQWPGPDQPAVYVPSVEPSAPMTRDEVRARLASARIRSGLSVSEEILAQIMAAGYAVDPERAGIYTASEQQDIYGDNERVDRARAVLTEAQDVLGGLQVCWTAGRRGIRVLLTGDRDRYRRLLAEVIDPERLVIDAATFTETEVARRGEAVRAHSEQLAADGIILTRSGTRAEGFVIEYLAADFERADRVLHDRFGDFATIRYQGASNHTFRPFPFGSWLDEGDRLHLFYALPRNGEQPGGCQVFETESAVVVSLTIRDWRGAKTLVGGFIASHATAQLSEPLGDRSVIDDADNRARPHWTDA
jgi:hypothetical protein